MGNSMKVEAGMNIQGRLRADGDLTIAGFVEGRVSAEGRVHVTRSGVVRAPISAEAAYIAGTVVGDVTCTDGVEIASGGRLEGDITAPRVLLREGAVFLGQVAMGPMVATSQSVAHQDERRGSEWESPPPAALPEARPAFEPVFEHEHEPEPVPATPPRAEASAPSAPRWEDPPAATDPTPPVSPSEARAPASDAPTAPPEASSTRSVSVHRTEPSDGLRRRVRVRRKH